MLTSASSLCFLRLLLSPGVLSISLSFLLCTYVVNNSPEFITECRTCRRQLRERSQTAGHHEGMPSDEELALTEVTEFQKSKGLCQSAGRGHAACREDFCTGALLWVIEAFQSLR